MCLGPGARLGQHLHPEEASTGGAARSEPDPHLREMRIHDVLAVAGTREPAFHDLFDRLRPVSDVLADQLLGIPGRAHPVGGRLAREILVLEVVVHGHVGRVPPRHTGERQGQSERRCWSERLRPTLRSAGPCLVNEL